MKYYGVFILLIFSAFALKSQDSDILKWKFSTGGKILANPVINDNLVYFGSLDSVFYALDIQNGEKKWELKSQSAIHSMPLVYGDIVYFKNKRHVLALNKDSGSLIWSYYSDNDTMPGQLDLWDYHSGSPAVYNNDIFFGFNNGETIGFNLINGQLTTRLTSTENMPVKSGLLVQDSLLFFGDWNGKIYCYNLYGKKMDWVYSTYEEQPYPTFGQVISQFSINNSLLYVGLRNPEFQVINVKTGKKQWSYVEKNGGWISGDPLVYNDTVYVGGSDNHEMFAFNATTGEKFWTYEFLNNNFSKPVKWKDYLLFTTGDAYNVWGNHPGTGYLYALNRTDGTIRNFHRFDGNIYSGLVVRDNNAYFGSSGGYFYCVDLLKFTDSNIDLNSKGYKAFDIISTEPNPFSDSIQIKLAINYPTDIEIEILDFRDNHIYTVFHGQNETGIETFYWNGESSKGHVEDGYFFMVISASEFQMKTIIQKKKQ